MIDWKEIEQLQADLQKAQQTVTTQRLSERNCVEILMKLEAMKMIDVFHSSDGKEYLTPAHLLQEIREELKSHGGRINLIELQSQINVDFSLIEKKCDELVDTNKDLRLVYGQLISDDYLDHIADEINDSLRSSGHVTFADLSQIYDLPGDFLHKEIPLRVGSIIEGRIDSHQKDTIYTESFLTRHKHRMRGVLSAATRPISISSLCSRGGLSVRLASKIIEELIGEGRVKGQVSGSVTESAIFIPSIHSQTQNQWIENFFKQNDYLEYDVAMRLGIADVKPYLQKRLGQGRPIFLQTVCVGRGIFDQLVAHVEETLANDEWSDVTALLPSCFSRDDAHQLLERVIKESAIDAIILCDVIVSGRKFVESCLDFFDPLIKEKADKAASKILVLDVSAQERKEVIVGSEGGRKTDKKEERRRRAQEGSGSSKRSGDYGGSGQGGREVKTKGVDKKKLRWQKEQEQSKRKTKEDQKGETGLEMEEVEGVLRNRLQDCPDDMIFEIATKLIRPISIKYDAAVKSVFVQQSAKESSGDDGTRRSRKQLEEEVNRSWWMLQLSAESIKLLPDDAHPVVHKHLLQTSSSHIADLLFLVLSNEFLPGVTVDTPISEEIRVSLIARLPTDMRPILTRLSKSLSGKNYDAFVAALEEAASPAVCDVMLKKLDKKKARQLIHSHKMSLLSQLEAATDPPTCLHLCVVIIFQVVMGTMIDIPGKLVPAVLQTLGGNIDRDVFSELFEYEQLVIKAASSGEGSDELISRMPRIKEFAATTKKQTSA